MSKQAADSERFNRGLFQLSDLEGELLEALEYAKKEMGGLLEDLGAGGFSDYNYEEISQAINKAYGRG